VASVPRRLNPDGAVLQGRQVVKTIEAYLK
jgi:hypothetical protein